MADVFSPQKRPSVMAAIRSRGNKDTELRLVNIMKTAGLTGWRRHLPLPGKPDFAFPAVRLAIFVDGCFWHGCPKHGRKPASNEVYWNAKLARNRQRDRAVSKALLAKGWKTLRIWEHELQDSRRVIRKISTAMA
jgi:DNA mismatch endonuclease (patch repair protein)